MGVVMTVAIAALLLGVAVLVLLVLVLIGIHHEERHMSLTGTPRTRIEAVTRRLLGVGVRRAEPCRREDQEPR
ncbi:MAG: hypothetical protein ACRDPY_00860 [Streptosporangiaceae bacterium]